MAKTQLGLITNVLEEVKRDLRQREIIIWLDKDEYYTLYIARINSDVE